MNARYYKEFQNENEARERAMIKTRAHAAGDRAIFVWLDGPDDNCVVCDLQTAIEIGLSYSWAV